MEKCLKYFLVQRNEICIATLTGFIEEIPAPGLQALQLEVSELSPKWILLNFAGVDDIRHDIIDKVPAYLTEIAEHSAGLKICAPRSNVLDKLLRAKLLPPSIFSNSIDEAIKTLAFKTVSYRR